MAPPERSVTQIGEDLNFVGRCLVVGVDGGHNKLPFGVAGLRDLSRGRVVRISTGGQRESQKHRT